MQDNTRLSDNLLIFTSLRRPAPVNSNSMEKKPDQTHHIGSFRQATHGPAPPSFAVVATVDRDLRLVSANRRFLEIFQSCPDARAGTPLSAMVEKSIFEEIFLKGLVQCVESEEAHLQSWVKSVSGEYHFLDMVFCACRADGESLESIVITGRNDRHRHRSTEALRQAENRYRSLFEESRDVVYFTTPDGLLVDVNPAGLALFGYASQAELVGRDLAQLIYINSRDRQAFKDQMLKDGHVHDLEMMLRRKDGSTITVLNNATVIRNAEDEVILFQGIIRDISEQKNLENQLIQSQKMEALGNLVGGISHDFNNILTAMLGFIDLAQTHSDNPAELSSNLEDLARSVNRAKNLVGQILNFSSKKEPKTQVVALGPILEDVINLLRATIPENIEIREQRADREYLILADPNQIFQVMLNLTTNAVHAMEESGGVLSIGLKHLNLRHPSVLKGIKLPPGDYLQITVRDNGQGIDAQHLSQIFDPFFTTKPIGKGSGMGLAVVHGIITRHQGYIGVSSAPGNGTDFSVFLPRVSAEGRSVSDPENGFPEGI